MPLNVRSIAVSFAVICFFGLSIIGWVSGLAPFTCCKKALVGALIAYVAASLAIKAINAILINAIITKHIKKQKENAGGGKD